MKNIVLKPIKTDMQPIMRVAPTNLDNLMSTLEVNFVGLSECLVSPGYRLELGGVDAPGIHYNLEGKGKGYIKNYPPIDLVPHTLIIVPPQTPFKIEVAHQEDTYSEIKPIDWASAMTINDNVHRFAAGINESEPEITLICGFFQASYGTLTNLFTALEGPIVEQFDTTDHLDNKLKSAMGELMSEEAGSGAMSAALLKQVIITILRRSLNSINLWVERFAILSDPRIARAFSEMAADPGRLHTVESLAEIACLSRSAFMLQFHKLVGHPPMAILRDLRMRQAAQLLRISSYSIDKIAYNVGYASRSSFVRAFKETYGCDPSSYRAKQKSALSNK